LRQLLLRTWMRVLGTLNEYQARLFVAEKALQLGRGGISHLSQTDRNVAGHHYSGVE